MPIGSLLASADASEEASAVGPPLRLIGVDRGDLEAILNPKAGQAADGAGAGWQSRLLANWEQQQQALAPAAITAATPMDPRLAPEPPEQGRQKPEDFPWVRGWAPWNRRWRPSGC